MMQALIRDMNDGIRDILEQAKQRLRESRTLKPEHFTPNVDTVETAIVHLRDRLIERLRGPETSEKQPIREALHQTNIALSLVVGLVYPLTGIKRGMIDEAERVLDKIKVPSGI